jgi:hypothetical protein
MQNGFGSSSGFEANRIRYRNSRVGGEMAELVFARNARAPEAIRRLVEIGTRAKKDG